MRYLHEWYMQQHNFLGLPPPGALGRGQRSNTIKSQFLSKKGCKVQESIQSSTTPDQGSQLQTFLNQTLCVFSQMIDIKHIRWDFHWIPWVMPKGLGLGGAWGQKFNFLNIVMWHVKLKGMNSCPGYTENFTPQSNW